MQEVAGSNPGRCIEFFIFFCLHFLFYGKNLAHKELINTMCFLNMFISTLPGYIGIILLIVTSPVMQIQV